MSYIEITLRSDLCAGSGESRGNAVDTAVLGNGIFAVDDDGVLNADTRAFPSGGLMVIVECE